MNEYDDAFRDWSYYLLRGTIGIGVVILAIAVWSMTPWFPWK